MFSSPGLVSTPARKPSAGNEDGGLRGSQLRQWLATLLACLGKGVRPAERTLRVEERLMVGGKKSVTLIACRGRNFLLVSSGDVITPLIEVLPVKAGENSRRPASQAGEGGR